MGLACLPVAIVYLLLLTTQTYLISQKQKNGVVSMKNKQPKNHTTVSESLINVIGQLTSLVGSALVTIALAP